MRIEDVFLSGQPDMGTIAREYGKPHARAVLVLLIAETLEYFNVKETMSDTQLATAIDLILEEYPHYQTDDFKLCFKNAMKGKYGETYNRIDGQVLFKWLGRYNRDRVAVADHQSYNEAQRHKSEQAQPTEGMYYPEARAAIEARAAQGDEQARRAVEANNWIRGFLAAQQLERQRTHLERFYAKIDAERRGR